MGDLVRVQWTACIAFMRWPDIRIQDGVVSVTPARITVYCPDGSTKPPPGCPGGVWGMGWG
jgi:hypothetical protein